MKKSFKKAIAVLLAVLMVVATLPFTAIAANAETATRPNINLQFGAFYSNENKTNTTNFQKYTSSLTRFAGTYFDNSGLNSAKLDYNKTTGTITDTSNSHVYTTGDYFTVTVLLENVTQIASTQIAIKYSDNIVPAGVQTTAPKGAYAGTTTGTVYSGYTAGEAIAAQSANALYNTTSTVGELSYVDDENNIMWADFAVQDGSDYATVTDQTFNGVTYSGKAILATFAFGIVSDGAVSFSLASNTDTDDAFYLATTENGGSTSEYITYAQTETSGSTGIDFMGGNEYVAKTEYTVIFQKADGTVISKDTYEEGTTVTVPDLPTKDPDATYHYTYAWDPAVSETATADATYTAKETATEHDFEYTVVTDATYTTTGTGRYTCKDCSYSYDVEIPVKTCTHNWVATGNETVVTEPTCTKDGVKQVEYKCSICEATKTENVAIDALGHEWGAYTYNGDASYTSSTTYTDGSATRQCSRCSEKETKTIAGTGLLRARTASCDFGGEIKMQIATKVAQVNMFDSVDCHFIREDGVETVVPDSEGYIRASSPTNKYYDYGVTPQGINSPVDVVFYAIADIDGEKVQVWGDKYTYTMTTNYIIPQLNKSSVSDSWKNLLVELVYFGAAAQTYAGYKTDNLMTNILTDEQKARHTTDELTLTNDTNVSYAVCENPETSWRAVSLVFAAGTQIKLRTKAMTNTSLDGITVEVEVDGTVHEYNAVDNADLFEKYTDTTGTGYYFYFKDLDAKYLRTPIHVTIKRNGVAITNTLQYSAEAYAAGRKTTSAEYAITQQQMRYGRAAEGYFNS